MTHLSPFSYLERGFHSIWVLGYCIHVILSNGGVAALHWKNLNGPKKWKWIITMMILLSAVLFILFDILGTGFKYIEGVVVEDPDCAEWVSGSGANTTCSASNCLCRAKASGAYSASSLKVKDACNHLLSWAFTTQSSAAFLFLVWLNDTLSSTMKMRVSGNRSVMSSLEYQVYFVYSFVSIALYQLLYFMFSFRSVHENDSERALLQVVVPQCVGHVEQLAVAVILLVTRVRIKRFTEKISHPGTVQKLDMFCYYMVFLAICFTLESVGLAAINVDILNFIFWGGDAKVYNNTATFAQDLCIVIFSTGWSMCPVPIILMLYPFDSRKAAKQQSSVISMMSSDSTRSISSNSGSSEDGDSVQDDDSVQGASTQAEKHRSATGKTTSPRSASSTDAQEGKNRQQEATPPAPTDSADVNVTTEVVDESPRCCS